MRSGLQARGFTVTDWDAGPIGPGTVLVYDAFDDAHVGPDDRGRARAHTREALDSIRNARQVVVLSSAIVYGAWPDNPVPLTEAATVRPNPELPAAMEVAEVEVMVERWAERNPDVAVAVLRVASPVAEDEASWLGEQMLRASLVAVGDEDPGWQFMHMDDLVSAVATVVRTAADGVFNVAPDGWLSGPERRELLGVRPRLWLPESLAAELTELGSRFGAGRLLPRGLVPYAAHSWVVSNDRLSDLGWRPRYTNAEAFVAADDAPPWADLNAGQRQELSLALVTASAVAAPLVASWWWHRLRVRRALSRPTVA